MKKPVALVAIALVCAMFAGGAFAQSWSAEQQELWRLEEQQWKLSAAEDMSWIDTMVHPNMRYWENGEPMPRGVASLRRWVRYTAESGNVLEQEIFPLSATITGNVAVVQYHYVIAREDHKKERKTVTGHYTDILVNENGRWLFIAWMGGDDPQQ